MVDIQCDIAIMGGREVSGTIFSGSAVVDKNNTAGLGKGAVVALYTSAMSGARFLSINGAVDRWQPESRWRTGQSGASF